KTDIPRGMRWNQSNEIFYRPVRWILALFGNNVVPVEFGGIKASHYTFGHRFLYPKKISVRNWKDYFDRIEKAFVIPDEQIRQTFIIKLINKSLKENEIFNKTVAENLANLVEYPCVIRCHFPDLQYNLPQDVLKIIIEKARCIPIFCQGRIQPEFFVVSDGNSGADISKNYENLLRTRILDAQFFYDSDLSLPFYQFKEKLEKIIFHPRWGSIADRVDRLVKIASIVSDIFNLTDEEKNIFIRAAELSKYDIASEMVKEFPDLQGTMGAIYADISGESRQVCTAIAQHILPRFYNDSMPEDKCAILLGIIDRIDYLCCFVSIDTDVSGSQDPYGLRRISTTLFQLIYKSAIDYDYAKIIDKIFVVYGFSPSELEMAKNKIKNFLLQRFEAHLEAKSVPKGLRTAVLTIEKMRFLRARYKLDAFKDFIRETSNVDTILIPVTRVANILKQAKEKNIHIDAFKKELLQQDEEIKLASIAEIYLARLNELLGKNNFKEFLCLLAELKQPIDAFFDKILVMCPEEDLRNNRLALLKMFNDVFLRFADFSFIREEDIKNAMEN
ncbi:MAG TPA: glycine--tRNA ligase subunit beta, partial [bacterium]|nr:glycine--tRNA ligase subunit beta [bacterium]